MTKEKLTYNYHLNYKIVAISTHLKDYRISFYINENLKIELKKIDNLSIDNKSKGTIQSFEQQYYEDIEAEKSFHLIHNKSKGLFFLNSLKKFDYLLLVKSENEIANHDDIIRLLKQQDHFQIIYKVDELSKREHSIIEKNLLYTE